MVTEVAARLTYEDYAKTPEDERYELIDGELIMTAAPNMLHQGIGAGLFRYFLIAVDRGLGWAYFAPVDVVLSEHDVVQPDLLFVLRENAHIITTANVQGPPGSGSGDIVAVDRSSGLESEARPICQVRGQGALDRGSG